MQYQAIPQHKTFGYYIIFAYLHNCKKIVKMDHQEYYVSDCDLLIHFLSRFLAQFSTVLYKIKLNTCQKEDTAISIFGWYLRQIKLI